MAAYGPPEPDPELDEDTEPRHEGQADDQDEEPEQNVDWPPRSRLANQPELPPIVGRVFAADQRRQQYCMPAQPPGGLTAGLSPGGD
jgi:hypothetical protein